MTNKGLHPARPAKSINTLFNRYAWIHTYPFLKKYRSPLIEVAASNTRSRLHCSFRGFGWRSGCSSVGSSGSGSGIGGGCSGSFVGSGVRVPLRQILSQPITQHKSVHTHNIIQSLLIIHIGLHILANISSLFLSQSGIFGPRSMARRPDHLSHDLMALLIINRHTHSETLDKCASIKWE